jgi:hypothetical protein
MLNQCAHAAQYTVGIWPLSAEVIHCSLGVVSKQVHAVDAVFSAISLARKFRSAHHKLQRVVLTCHNHCAINAVILTVNTAQLTY